MKKYLYTVPLLLTALVVGGCGHRATADDYPQSFAPAEEVEPSDETLSAEAEPEPEAFTVTLGFAGDICFADSEAVMKHYHEVGDDITQCIDPAYLDAMKAMDLMWVNNEFCYSDRGTPMPGKMWTFCSNPKNVALLDTMGVDIVGLANNHVFDYGADAFYDTLDTLTNAGIPYVGAGRNSEEAAAPIYLECNGITIAYVAASRAEKYILTPEAGADSPGVLRCYDPTAFLASISEAAEHADYVVALPHWGTEHTTELEEVQLTTGKAYLDAGADIVIGAHSHCLQGMEFYDGKPILYSLGNFWFDEYTSDTMVVQVTLRGTDPANLTAQVSILPGTQSNLVTTMASTDEEKQRIYSYIEKISTNIAIDDVGNVTEQVGAN